MTPERKFIDVTIINAQQARFDALRASFGEAYSRGQNMFGSLGADLLARVSGRQTPSQELNQIADDLNEARLSVAEARARRVAQTAPNDSTYRQRLARVFARSHRIAGEEILNSTDQENTSLGFLDEAYRWNMRPEGSTARVLIGGGLLIAAGGLNLIQGPNALTASEIGVFLAATGAVDLARSLFLGETARTLPNLNTASLSNLIRRKASVQEGQITGDGVENANLINVELQNRLQQETLNELNLRATGKPNFVNLLDMTDILAQRDALRARVENFADVRELIKARNIARVSRLTRTLLYTVLAVGIINFHMGRHEYCGTRDFPNPDTYIESITGGASGISSIRGIAANEWFKRIYSRDFVRGQDEALFGTAYDLDPEGNEQLIWEIGRQIKTKNPQRDMVGRDFVQHGLLNDICRGEQNRIYNQHSR